MSESLSIHSNLRIKITNCNHLVLYAEASVATSRTEVSRVGLEDFGRIEAVPGSRLRSWNMSRVRNEGQSTQLAHVPSARWSIEFDEKRTFHN